jgi:hypothetical protein
MTDRSKPGDKVGYVVLELDRYDDWVALPLPMLSSIGQAVGAIRGFEQIRADAAMPATYAVGSVSLAMISRPGADPT